MASGPIRGMMDEEVEEDPRPSEPEVVIERRELVGKIKIGGGTKNVLTLAFEMIGEWMPNNLGPEPMNIEFIAYGRKFEVHVGEEG